MLRARLAVQLLMLGGLTFGQSPPVFFQLEIPELQGKVFDGDVIELPLSRIQSLIVHVLAPMADAVAYGKIYPRLNGDAASVVCQYRSSPRGKALYMNLRMREDIRLLPGANALEITAVNTRGRKFYKNWVIRTREISRNEYFAYEQKLSAADEFAMSPDIMIAEPVFPVIFQKGQTSGRIRVRGTISAVNPLATATINGERLSVNSSDQATLDEEISLTPRDSAVVIHAVDSKGNAAQLTIPVIPSPTVRRPPRFQGEKYAIVIGISRYKTLPGAPPPLPTAAAGASDLGHLLLDSGFKEENLLLLTDEKASTAALRNAFRNFSAKAKPDDLLVIYFAGHGLHDPSNPERIYLAAHDTQMAQISDTALDITDVESLLSTNVRSKNTLLIFDVGQTYSDDWKIAGTNLANAYLLRVFGESTNRSVIVAAGLAERSLERVQSGHAESVFTRWMIEGIKGAADWNHDGIVSTAEVFRFVTTRVREETRGAQTPRFIPQKTDIPITAGAASPGGQ